MCGVRHSPFRDRPPLRRATGARCPVSLGMGVCGLGNLVLCLPSLDDDSLVRAISRWRRCSISLSFLSVLAAPAATSVGFLHTPLRWWLALLDEGQDPVILLTPLLVLLWALTALLFVTELGPKHPNILLQGITLLPKPILSVAGVFELATKVFQFPKGVFSFTPVSVAALLLSISM